MNLKELLGRAIVLHRAFVDVGGSVSAGVFLSHLYFWSGKGKNKDKWIWKTYKEWKHETGLTRYEVDSARKRLGDLGLLEFKRMGPKGRMHYRLNEVMLESLLLAESSKHNCCIQQTQVLETANSYQESTTGKTQEKAQAHMKTDLKGKSTTESILETLKQKPNHETLVSQGPKSGPTFFWYGMWVLYQDSCCASLTIKQQAQLKQIVKKLPDKPYKRLGVVLSNWIKFTNYAEKTHGEYKMPLVPDIGRILKSVQAVASFTSETKLPETKKQVTEPVQLIAGNHQAEKAMTLEEMDKIDASTD